MERDPARIDQVLEVLRKVWAEFPDLRLGQLLVNAIRPAVPRGVQRRGHDPRAQAGGPRPAVAEGSRRTRGYTRPAAARFRRRIGRSAVVAIAGSTSVGWGG
jgi:hypothetical protein